MTTNNPPIETITITGTNDYFSTDNTMYYTNSTGTLSTITIDTSSLIDTSPLINTSSYSPGSTSWEPLTSIYNWPNKEFESHMPDLTKVKEMCTMYPALDKAFENFKAIYDLIKDDYKARKSNDS